MPTVRIDDEVFKALQDQAHPFVDTPNDVLRRLLGVDSVPMTSIKKSVKGKPKVHIGATPQPVYRQPIIQALHELGGSAQADDVLNSVYKQVEEQLNAADHELMKSGEPRWRLYARFERKNMALEGLLKPDSAHGWWELTLEGNNYQGQK